MNDAKKVTWDTIMEYTLGAKKKTRSLKLVIMQKKSKYNNIFTRGFISYSKWLKNCLVILMEILIYILNVC